MVSPLLGAGAALASQFIPNMKVWSLRNLDSDEVVQGQFEAQNVSEQITTTWAQHTSLNRENAISQFVHGNSDQVSFSSRFFKNNAFDTTPEEKLKKLKSWAKIDPSVRRPPILQFWVGDGHLTVDCYISGIAIDYGRPEMFGGLRDVTFNMSLNQFSSFSIDDEGVTDTIYVRAKERDYYELIAFYQYGNPLIGDIVRKDHPTLQRLDPGEIVKFPSIEGIRSKEVTQTSTALKTAFGKRDTPQKRLRIAFFESRSGSYVSHLLKLE